MSDPGGGTSKKRRVAAMMAAVLGTTLPLALIESPAPPAAAAAVSSSGYDLVGSDGGVFVFAPQGTTSGFYGSLPGQGVHVNNIVGMVATADDHGYFLVGSDGGVFAFGDAPYPVSYTHLRAHETRHDLV